MPLKFKIKTFIDNLIKKQNEELLRQIAADTGLNFADLCVKYLQPTFYSIDLEGSDIRVIDSYFNTEK